MILRWLLIASIATLFGAQTSMTNAQQECVQYHLVPKTVYEKRPVTKYRWVNETQYETQRVTEQVPVYSTEKREKVSVYYVPKTVTRMQDEEYSVLRPVTETKYREETYQETEYETVTEMRDREFVVEKPVIETQYREERVLVRKPVRRTEMRYEDVTTYRPVETTQTDYVPGYSIGNQWVQAPGSNRSKLDWLQRGYYWDAAEGRYVFRRGGFHWTNPGTIVTNQPVISPTLIPQQRTTTSYLAETSRRQKPVDVVEMDERIEVRKIPVEVQRTQRRTEVRKVPVQVERPVNRTRTVKVPYEEQRMERVTRVRRVPVEETTWERRERVEPYERVTARWEEKTREVRRPKTVTRRVPYTVMENIPRTVWMKVPVDAFGNVLGNPIPIESSVSRPAARETMRREPTPVSSILDRSTRETSQRNNDSRQRISYDRPARSNGAASVAPEDSIVVPESVPTAANAETPLMRITRRPVIDENGAANTEENNSDDQNAERPIRIQGEFEPAGDDPELEASDELGEDERREDTDPIIIGG